MDWIWIIMTIAIAWIMFWLARTLIIYNNEGFVYKQKKVCHKKMHPVLYHAELFSSVFLFLIGIIMLYTALASFL